MKTKTWGKLELLKIDRVCPWKSGKGAFLYVGKKRYVWPPEMGQPPAAGSEFTAETRFAWSFRSWAIVDVPKKALETEGDK